MVCDNVILFYYVLQAFNNTWDCRVYTSGITSYVPQFPFFMEVSSLICKMIEESMVEILQEHGNRYGTTQLFVYMQVQNI